jgi:hypothetical protein
MSLFCYYESQETHAGPWVRMAWLVVPKSSYQAEVLSHRLGSREYGSDCTERKRLHPKEG